jgi:thioredoxin:protein disulfide reductase
MRIQSLFTATAFTRLFGVAILALLAHTAIAQQSSSAKPNQSLQALFKSEKKAEAAQDEYLEPDQAFQFSASMTKPDAITLHWTITKAYYLYQERFKVSTESTLVKLGELQFPPGIKKTDDLGDHIVYHDEVTIIVPVARAADAKGEFTLIVKYQGCAEAGLCYVPMTKTVKLTLPAATDASTLDSSALNANNGNTNSSKSDTASGDVVSEQDRLAILIRDGNLLLVLATFFGLGALLSLTPCVLPMIPILSGIIVGQGEKVTPMKGFSLAFTYVQGMAMTYAAAGAAFVLAFKQAPQAFFQKPPIVIGFAILFVALAFAMFGAFTLQMPSVLQSKLTDVSNKQKSGTYIGTFVMGALSALIVTACVAPAMIAALSVISQTHMIARGAAALYVMGLGMGLPLLLVGASAGSLLPRAGAWMDTVKIIFGVMFIALAVYILNPILPAMVSMLLWSVLTVVFGYWLFTLSHGAKPASSVVRGFGILSLVYGITLLLGALAGRTDPLQPLAGLGGAMHESTVPSAAHSLPFKRIKSIADLDREVAAAASSNKSVMLDFYADWCTSCKEMEKFTFTDQRVVAALSNTVLLQADVTANDSDDQALLKRFGIFGPPSIMFFGADGNERKNFSVVGYMKADEFHTHVTAAFSS